MRKAASSITCVGSETVNSWRVHERKHTHTHRPGPRRSSPGTRSRSRSDSRSVGERRDARSPGDKTADLNLWFVRRLFLLLWTNVTGSFIQQCGPTERLSTMSGSREEERRKLADIINHWNANRLDLFEISRPTEVGAQPGVAGEAADTRALSWGRGAL